jgi:hypothetical protein
VAVEQLPLWLVGPDKEVSNPPLQTPIRKRFLIDHDSFNEMLDIDSHTAKRLFPPLAAVHVSLKAPPPAKCSFFDQCVCTLVKCPKSACVRSRHSRKWLWEGVVAEGHYATCFEAWMQNQQYMGCVCNAVGYLKLVYRSYNCSVAQTPD